MSKYIPIIGPTHHFVGVNGDWGSDPNILGWWQRRAEAVATGRGSVEIFLLLGGNELLWKYPMKYPQTPMGFWL